MPAEAHALLAAVLRTHGPFDARRPRRRASTTTRVSSSAGASPPKGWSPLRLSARYECARASMRARRAGDGDGLAGRRRGCSSRSTARGAATPIGHSELGPHAPPIWREAMRRRGIRVIAIRRDLDPPPRRRPRTRPASSTSSPRARARVAGSRAPPHDRATSTRSCRRRRRSPPATDSTTGWEPDDDRYVLVCTNGRHDRVLRDVRPPDRPRRCATSQWADEVWECSHIGGDRFAGNVVLLPDSLYFGRLDLAGRRAGARRPRRRAGSTSTSFRGRSTFRLARAGGRALRAAPSSASTRSTPSARSNASTTSASVSRSTVGDRRGRLRRRRRADRGAGTEPVDVHGQGRAELPGVPLQRAGPRGPVSGRRHFDLGARTPRVRIRAQFDSSWFDDGNCPDGCGWLTGWLPSGCGWRNRAAGP